MDQWQSSLVTVASELWHRVSGAPTGGPTEPAAALELGSIVTPASDLASVQTTAGFLVASERLGPGTVQEITPDDQVRVFWSRANVESWSTRDELLAIARNRRLVTVLRCDSRGHKTLLRQKVAPLPHHWTVELRPDNVLRAERADGYSWTFKHMSSSHEVICGGWFAPPEDDDAEALTAAELAVA